MTIAGQEARAARPAPKISGWVHLPTNLVARAASQLGRMFVGSGEGPRGYRREGYPEHELHQIVAGRKDRFDGLM